MLASSARAAPGLESIVDVLACCANDVAQAGALLGALVRANGTATCVPALFESAMLRTDEAMAQALFMRCYMRVRGAVHGTLAERYFLGRALEAACRHRRYKLARLVMMAIPEEFLPGLYGADDDVPQRRRVLAEALGKEAPSELHTWLKRSFPVALPSFGDKTKTAARGRPFKRARVEDSHE
jgi:hypothetical protein